VDNSKIKIIAKEITASMDLGDIADGAHELNDQLVKIEEQINDLTQSKYQLLHTSDVNAKIDVLCEDLYSMMETMGKKIISRYKGMSFARDTEKKFSPGYKRGTIAIAYDHKDFKGMNYALLSFSILVSTPQYDVFKKSVENLQINATYNVWSRAAWGKGGKGKVFEEKGNLPVQNTVGAMKTMIDQWIQKGYFEPNPNSKAAY
jgi:hypothetical protein